MTIYPTLSIPNDLIFEDQNYLELKSYVCKNLDRLFQGKMLKTVFFRQDFSSQILQGDEQHSLIFEASNFDYFYICVKQNLSWYLQFAKL